ncbi:hypothetical protein [Spirillospora sp. CA-294931]|uniref:hypothetical protein n=1 Tax=Spirillospora sp. CA-294931 TaxID=3240042 RepID=UPI003D92A81A
MPSSIRAADVLAVAFTVWAVTTGAAWFLGSEVQGQVSGVPLATVGAASLAALVSRRRTMLVALHCVLIPVLFALVIVVGSFQPFLGMALSTALLVAIKPAFPRLRPPARKLWLTLHVASSSAWLGASTTMAVLSFVGLLSPDPGARRQAYAFMHLLDLALVIPMVLLSIATGLVLSLGTQWGLLNHWWVVTKFVIALAIVATAAAWENFLVRGLAEAAAAAPPGDPAGRDWSLAACMVVFVGLLLTATAFSVLKPGGRTKRGRRDLRRAPASARA